MPSDEVRLRINDNYVVANEYCGNDTYDNDCPGDGNGHYTNDNTNDYSSDCRCHCNCHGRHHTDN